MARSMLAVVKEDGRTSVRQVPVPELRDDEDLLVRVMNAGICRTDLLAARSEIDTLPSLVLGHEFGGVIAAAGKGAGRLREGDRVTVNPIGACRGCERCHAGDETNCLKPRFLGLRRDGGFAEFVRVGRRAIYKVPETVSFREAAYAEPIAAGLAVLKAGIHPDERGLIVGTNRIAALIHRVLIARGFQAVERAEALEDLKGPLGHYDFAIETNPSARHFSMILQAIRRRGKIILRSRVFHEVAFPLQAALSKEPVLHVVNYGSFQEAVDLVASRSLNVRDLFGSQYPLADFANAFAAARDDEAKKVFFTIGVA